MRCFADSPGLFCLVSSIYSILSSFISKQLKLVPSYTLRIYTFEWMSSEAIVSICLLSGG